MDLSFHVQSGQAPNNFIGPGIYGLCFREDVNDDWRLIYIGRYLGEAHSTFSGNVATVRWWTHLASVTMRGDKVSAVSSVIGALQPGLLYSAIFPQSACLAKPRGCVTSVNRAKFAKRYWHHFSKHTNGAILDYFKFVYVRVDPNIVPKIGSGNLYSIDKKIEQVRLGIISAEDKLIKRLSPECNNVKTSFGSTDCASAKQQICQAICELEKSL